MNQNPVVSSVIKALNPEQTEQAKTAGSLFAHSELDADKAFESFARAITESPTFVMYEESRILWVSGYLDIKPQAKGNTADAAFKRFKDRLVEKYGIDITKPKSDNPAAEKKRAERETKRAELVKAFENRPTEQLKDDLSKAFTTLAQNPDSKVAGAAVKNLRAVIKERTKDEQADLRAEIIELKVTIRTLLSSCSDIERLQAVIEVLSPDNEITIQ